MITFFTSLKPSRDAVTRASQTNALSSWGVIGQHVQIIICGEHEALSARPAHPGISYVSDLRYNTAGTPLVDSIFEAAQQHARHDLLCYINADIILFPDVVRVIALARHMQGRGELFLCIGQRYDAPFPGAIDFNTPGWEKQLHDLAEKKGHLHPPTGIDYFLFPKGLFSKIPPFALGRTVWDAWLVYEARRLGVPVIDATACITAIHQNHDYPAERGGMNGVWGGEEAAVNRALARGRCRNISHATHRLTRSGTLRRRTAYLAVEPALNTLRLFIATMRGRT